MPDLILVGPPGCGKTTLATALVNAGATCRILHSHGAEHAYVGGGSVSDLIHIRDLLEATVVNFVVNFERTLCCRHPVVSPETVQMRFEKDSQDWPERAAATLLAYYPELR